jgi:hypothetical protein
MSFLPTTSAGLPATRKRGPARPSESELTTIVVFTTLRE